MAIELSPDTERQIQELVQSGRFESAEQAVRRSVEHLREHDRWIDELANRDDIKQQVEEGLQALKDGRYTVYDSAGLLELAEQIKREGRLEQGLPPESP